MNRPRIPRESDFTSRLRSPTVAARVGVPLGICFGLAFLTGLFSHWQQVPHPWLAAPTSPSWLYRVNQGLHVASGTASIPLLLVKLWAVFPKLFVALPDLRRPAAAARDGLERASIAVLVASGIFMLASGLANSSQWYPWDFHFRATHYAVSWIAIGALVVHIGVKLPMIREALGAPIDSRDLDRPGAAVAGAGLSRRGLVRTAWGAAAVAVLASAGSTVPLLRKVSVFGVRSGNGPQGVPINKSAYAARVTALATAADYVLEVRYGDRMAALTARDLLALPRRTSALPIACVEGWSAQGVWAGPRLRDVLAHVGAPYDADVRVTSLQPRGPFRVSHLPASFAQDERTLVATHLNGQRLSIDHGYPCRLIAPDRPGVLQTKWLARLEVES